MKRKAVGFFLFLAAAVSFGMPQGVRKPAFAGQFYDADPERLRSQIGRFLEAAGIAPDPRPRVSALIVPHAGYVYSGQTAAHGYRLVQGLDFESIVIIGPSHRHGFNGGAIYPRGGFETPLGTAAVDEALAEELAREAGLRYVSQAFEDEHSVEVQVPFVQFSLPKARIVPVVLGIADERFLNSLARTLAKIMARPRVLVVASTDMSHYLSKAEANAVDSETASLIRGLKTNALIRKITAGENILCGGAGVAAVLLAAQKLGAGEVRILRYADSSEAGGPDARVVGYLAAAVIAPDAIPPFSLSAQEKKELLRMARAAVESCVRNGKIPETETNNPNFLADRGAFVTLKKKGELRGCIGFIEPVFPLARTVVQAAVNAATKDPRFPPITERELRQIEVEISVLTPLRKISDPGQVRVGTHGLVISQGRARGLLLPQVPVEQGWDRDMFLQQACVKAGLPETAWKTGAEIFIFEAIVFH